MKTLIKMRSVCSFEFKIFFLFVLFVALLGQSEQLAYRYTPSVYPDRIILNLTVDPHHSIAVTWRTNAATQNGLVQYIKSTPGPVLGEHALSVAAQSETYKNAADGEPEIEASFHSAILTDLESETLYAYRVGDGTHWSEWLHFTTANDQATPFSFLYFGDVQNNIRSHWSRLVREAFRTAPDAGFVVYAGDLINRSGSDMGWGEWFEGGAFIHAMIPSIMTPGNHEYNKQQELDPHWRRQFTLPENGVTGLEETCFYVDYQNLRIISIDAEMLDEIETFETAQAKWLNQILTDNPQKWTALTLHFPFYSTKPNRDNPRLREVFRPIIEKHAVDIVLQGHDHAYGRGMLAIPSALDSTQISNTMYVVSVSGPKMYDISENEWMRRRARNTQLFQVITIADDTLRFAAYTATRELYDAFDLVKRADGKNRLINRIPDTPERLE
ncbi:metallophosphoesterase family protein [candidate division KSB1 bacterium]|nr:metallophosphoesterase family protein [candidate division KSB1 bacterium]RQW00717.1 MAG: metallophosphoesterase family protein [candidate division KSB1 bacterium]